MRSRALRRTGACLLTGAGLLLVGACGSDSGATASDPVTSGTSAMASPSASDPDCATVWVAGERLASGYTGCLQDGTLVPVHKVSCESGQTFAIYDHHYWAVMGGTGVIKYAPEGLTGSTAYAEDLASCTG